MGNTAAPRKEKFPSLSISQETIDKLYQNFCCLSKIEGGNSGESISEKAIKKIMKPMKNLGSKLHAFLASQSVSQSLDFETFLFFSDFFLKTTQNTITNYSQMVVSQDNGIYNDWITPLQMLCMISIYSNSMKNKIADPQYLSRISITFRQALQILKELQGLAGILAMNIDKKHDESLAKRIVSMIYGDSYELLFHEFIEKLDQIIPLASSMITKYFTKLLLETQIYLNDRPSNLKQDESLKGLLSFNALSSLALFMQPFTDYPYKERTFIGTRSNFEYSQFSEILLTRESRDSNIIILISHLVDHHAGPSNDENNGQIQEQQGLDNQINTRIYDKQKHLLGIFLPSHTHVGQALVLLEPSLLVFTNIDRQNFLNVEKSATVVLFGEEEMDMLYLADNLISDSYIKSTEQGFSHFKPTYLQIEQIEIWEFSKIQNETEKNIEQQTPSTTLLTETSTEMSDSGRDSWQQPQQQQQQLSSPAILSLTEQTTNYDYYSKPSMNEQIASQQTYQDKYSYYPIENNNTNNNLNSNLKFQYKSIYVPQNNSNSIYVPQNNSNNSLIVPYSQDPSSLLDYQADKEIGPQKKKHHNNENNHNPLNNDELASGNNENNNESQSQEPQQFLSSFPASFPNSSKWRVKSSSVKVINGISGANIPPENKSTPEFEYKYIKLYKAFV